MALCLVVCEAGRWDFWLAPAGATHSQTSGLMLLSEWFVLARAKRCGCGGRGVAGGVGPSP